MFRALRSASSPFLTGVRSLSTGSPFRVLGVQQIALGSLELDGLKGLWVDAFGAKEVKSFKSEKENVDGEWVRGRAESGSADTARMLSNI